MLEVCREPQVCEITRLGGVTHLSVTFLKSRLHAKWGDPPRRAARSVRPGNALSQGQILPSKRFKWGSRGQIRVNMFR